MYKTLKLAAVSLIGLAASGAVLASGALADPDEPHGVVRTDVEQTAHQIYPVDVVEIDGDLVSVASKNALWLKPGQHTLTVRANVAMESTFGIKRTVGSGDSPNELTLTVEPGKIYYVGMKAVRGEPYNFKPVVWKVVEGAS